ncbi:MAG: hypothetical protein Q8L14_24825 [Myxococcales bacterium]|nr:hypothetical protein [Myxococcales bacterium]
MTNTQRGALAAVAVVMIALGLFLVLGNEPATPATSTAPVAEVGPAPAAVTGTGPAPSQPTTGAPAAAIAAAATNDAGAEQLAKTGPTVEFAPSPFEGSDSAELQYAVKLVLGETTGPREWHKAAEVFQRCVDQNPTNHLCKRGVYAAWERIDSDGGQPTALTKTGALGVDPSKLQNPTERPDGLVAPTLKERALAE